MEISCNVCHSSRHQIRAQLKSEVDGRDYFAILCEKCGLIFAHPLPPSSFELLQNIYDEEYTEGQRVVIIDPKEDEALQLAVHRQMDIVEKYANKGCVLNVGAMSKSNIVFVERGWKLHVVEVSQYAAKTAHEKWGFDITLSRIEDYSCPPNTYDLIKLGHVIEHLFDPRMVIEKLHKMLKPGGIILIETDNSQGLKTNIEIGIRRIFGEKIAATMVHKVMKKNLLKRYGRLTPPEHVYLFSKKNLSSLLHSLGFSVIEVFQPAWGDLTWFPLPNIDRFGLIEKSFIFIDQIGAKFDRGDVIVALARKDK
jgi:SAM-dependent methyltransferase